MENKPDANSRNRLIKNEPTSIIQLAGSFFKNYIYS